MKDALQAMPGELCKVALVRGLAWLGGIAKGAVGPFGRVSLAAAAAAAALGIGGCASTAALNPADPFEPANRVVFEFNQNVDKAFVKPVAQAYRAALPQPVRTGVRNFYGNLWDPWIGLNNLLQGKVEWALSDLFRFAVNTTFGLGGIHDPATEMRLEKHNEDFGQTLGRWGVQSGPYLVLPIFGPSSVRDGAGLVVDSYGYLPWRVPTWRKWSHYVAWRNSLSALGFVSLRASLLDAESVLEEAALDRYAFVRDAYLQRRRNLVYDGEPPRERPADGAAAPPFDDLALEPPRAVAPPWAAPPWAAPPWAAPPWAAPHARGFTDMRRVVEPRVPTNYAAVLAASAGAAPAREGAGE